jgi:hypothetical protein
MEKAKSIIEFNYRLEQLYKRRTQAITKRSETNRSNHQRSIYHGLVQNLDQRIKEFQTHIDKTFGF